MQNYHSVLQEGEVYLSLSTFNPEDAQPPFLNSPRSLEACRLHGISPIELAGRLWLLMCIYSHMFTIIFRINDIRTIAATGGYDCFCLFNCIYRIHRINYIQLVGGLRFFLYIHFICRMIYGINFICWHVIWVKI